MSDTPLTDAVLHTVNYGGYPDGSGDGVTAAEAAYDAYRALCEKLERALAAKTAECERLREDATRTLWAVVFAAGGDVAVPHSLLISQDKQNILERIEYPSMTTVFKAARKETP